jgi:hypothetical protein
MHFSRDLLVVSLPLAIGPPSDFAQQLPSSDVADRAVDQDQNADQH